MPVLIVPANVTVNFSELEGSPTERFTKDGFVATRQLVCAWADRLALGQQLEGAVSVSGPFVTRTLPASYPDLDFVHVSSVSIEPFDEDRPMPKGGTDLKASQYEWAKLTVEYSAGVIDGSTSGDEGEEILVRERIEPFAEFMTLPPDGFRWKDASGPALKEEEAPGKLFKGFNWVYSMSYVPQVPSAVYDLVGKVNSGTLQSRKLGYTFAAETLLYNPPVLDRVTTASGTKAWSLEYRFTFKPQNWNKFWRNDGGSGDKWQRIVKSNGDPADPYETGDFTALITI